MPITETFFPALLQACDDDPNDALDIQLTCRICHEMMTFEDEAGPHLRAKSPSNMKQPIPRDLEIPIKIIAEGLLKAHGIAGPDDGSTAFKYEICLYELRDKEHGILADERRLIDKTEQEVREYRVGYRKLMVLDLAFDMRDYWSDENVRERMSERSERAKRSAL